MLFSRRYLRLVLVDMITVLVVTMTVMDVVNMIAVLHGFVTISFEMFTLMALMDDFFGVHFAVVYVVDVAFVFNGFVSVAWQMLVVRRRMSIGHWGIRSLGRLG